VKRKIGKEKTSTGKAKGKTKQKKNGGKPRKKWKIKKHVPSEEDKERQVEFLRVMQERFLSGLDDDQFDYDTIDKNQDYDDLRTQEWEDQETFFDQPDLDEDDQPKSNRNSEPLDY